MRFGFTDDQLELRSTVRQVLERECDVQALRAFTPETDPPSSGARWAVLAQLGAPASLIPESSGGLGLGPVDLVAVIEEAGWFALPENLADTAGVAVPVLIAAQSGGVWLQAIAERSSQVAVGGVEVASASLVDPGTIEGDTRFTPRVVGGTRAGCFVLCSKGERGWEIHAVGADQATVRPTPSLDTTRGLATVGWHASGETLLAQGADAASLVEQLANAATLYSAAQLLGLSDRMITMAAVYAKARVQFAKPIGSFQAVKHLLANARVKLEFARPAVYRAALSLEHEVPTLGHDVSIAKALASDAADDAARVALQVHGAIGYTWECELHFFMKRAWALSSSWGDARVHRARVLAAALGGL